jgi:hypothetical protein
MTLTIRDSASYHKFSINGAWLSLVERSVRDREVVGSNPIAPTFRCNELAEAERASVFSL